MALEIFTQESIDAQYAEALAQGLTFTKEDWQTWSDLWNAQAPIVNKACNPEAVLQDVTSWVMAFGPEAIKASIAQSNACDGCVEGAYAAVEIAFASQALIRPDAVVAEAENLLRNL